MPKHYNLTYKVVCDELGVVKYRWRSIGVQLGIPYHKLMEFAKEEDSLASSINYWLCGNVDDVPVSWRSVVKALESSHVGETGLARKIREKYCCKEEENTTEGMNANLFLQAIAKAM